jgi:thiamine-monophosphate kinase
VTAVRLGPGREFDVIRGILTDRAADTSLLQVGPGDDAAVLRTGARVLSTDLSVEDVHFRRSWLEPWEVGYRAAMAALSDLAAMGADPRAILVSLAGTPADAESGFLAEVGRGTERAAREVGAVLAGGDVTRSPGPVVVDVVAVGNTDSPVLRSEARPGDEVWVTGALGAAAGAVSLWKRGVEPPLSLRDRFARPVPRIAAMQALRRTGLLTAGMDLSDGLAGDAGHIAAASDVEMSLVWESVPVHPDLPGAVEPDEARRLALTGGEDYELLVTARPGLESWVDRLREDCGVRLTRVGTVEQGRGVRVAGANGDEDLLAPTGFDHFGSATSSPGTEGT